MAIKEIRKTELPAALQGKEIKEAKYKRKHGKIAVLPIIILLMSLAAADIPNAHCTGVDLNSSGQMQNTTYAALMCNRTAGVTNRLWVYMKGDTSSRIYNLNADLTGSLLADGSKLNCSMVSIATAGEGICTNDTTGDFMWIIAKQTHVVTLVNSTCGSVTTYDIHDDPVGLDASVVCGIATNVTQGAATDFWIVEGGASSELWHLNASFGVGGITQNNCSLSNIGIDAYGVEAYGGKIYVTDNTGKNITEIEMNGANCTNVNSWNIGGTNTINSLTTSDGKEFYYIDYTAGEVHRVSDDTTAPTLRNLGANMTYIARNDSIQLWGQSYDNCNCTYSWIRSNESGAYLDISGGTSNTSIGAYRTWTNTTYNWKNTTYYCSLNVGYKVCAMDTAGNMNCSEASTFYKMPYLYSSTPAFGSPTCTSDYAAVWVATATGNLDVTVYVPPIYRNATHSECNYELIPSGRIEITNETMGGRRVCVINGSPDSMSSGDTLTLQEAEELKGASPPNLPAALAGLMATLMILVYSYTAKRT